MNQANGSFSDDDIDLRELFSIAWRAKWLILVSALIFALGGIGYALVKPDIYKASVLLAPTQDDSGSIANLSGQLGGLASIAGINLNSGNSSKTSIAKAVLESHSFLEDFIYRYDLEPLIFSVKGWDKETDEWEYDYEIYNPKTEEWQYDSSGKSLKPSPWLLVKRLKEDHIEVTESKDTGLITVSVQHYSPETAAQWAESLVKGVNEHMRSKDVQQARASIAYLEEKLEQTNITGMQQVFYQLIEGETRTIMLANARNEYVFETIDSPVAPDEPYKPRRPLIVLLSTFFGLIVGFFIVFVKSFILSSRYESDDKN
ncbi:LPS O-antigen length regulator [Marinobacter flavimaris]|uniref:LPS O-antigen length regulator n=1 Tax=Marinobacter flavimaris TaxID=262076 RepID=A0A3D8H6N3_9GAMM|nr:Wzz/FepE/Etk N-terminal domain-containing protein [Marinobacter flavimaris]PPI81931.1 LPS O-antigen length regulator [Marinobacter flavimaris]RDU42382.1 LPS O-antigen length regulator [Marinobacter flavimaris]